MGCDSHGGGCVVAVHSAAASKVGVAGMNRKILITALISLVAILVGFALAIPIAQGLQAAGVPIASNHA